MPEVIEVDLRGTLNLRVIKKLMIKLNAVCLSVTSGVYQTGFNETDFKDDIGTVEPLEAEAVCTLSLRLWLFSIDIRAGSASLNKINKLFKVFFSH